ncbi:MAG: flagellar hook-associated protein 3 [Calditrichaeota bacterium]|nr:MAG: flagellar hook-associated protein 3 [Calditrichota bacterium]
MRVTQNYSIQSLLRQINYSRERINTLQRNLATGKRINQISDDPANIEVVLRFRNMLQANAQYEENINNVMDFLTFSSGALDESSNILTTIRELAVQGADSTSPEEFQAIQVQVEELVEKLVNVANTRFKGRYIFGGDNVTTAPFTLMPDYSAVNTNPSGVDGKLKAEIGKENFDVYNITGKEAFLYPQDVFKTVLDLRTALVNQDSNAIQNSITELDKAIDQVLEVNTKAGAKINRYEMILTQYQNEDLRLQEFLSNVEDTDMAKAVVELQGEQTSLETALKTLAQTLNISLIDFMR